MRQFTLDRTAADTGLEPREIERLAATIHAGERVSFWWTMGVNQSYQGVRTAQAVIDLALLTGNMGRPGTGANSITGQCNAMGSRLFSNTTNLLGGHDFADPGDRAKVAGVLGIDPGVIPHEPSWAYHEIVKGILEAAKAAHDLGLETHVIEFMPRLTPRQVDDAGSRLLVEEIEKLGVRVRVGAATKAILGNGRVQGMAFDGGGALEVGMVIVSAGIRPRDELARACGLAVAQRGGVVVDDFLETTDPDIHAIGEVAHHRGIVYGLVAPGYEMAEVLAARLAGDTARVFSGADLSTKLKLMGVDNPELRRKFRQFVNTDETEVGIEFVDERGQQRPEYWDKAVIPVEDVTRPAEDGARALRDPSGKRWVNVGRVADFPADGGAAVKYGRTQIAVFNFSSRGEWYATQNMCPHKQAFVLSRGIVGDAQETPKVACPLHKKAFGLDTGTCLSGESYELMTFPVKVDEDRVYLELPAEEQLDDFLGTDTVCGAAARSRGPARGASKAPAAPYLRSERPDGQVDYFAERQAAGV